jgi:hypothetical protein
LVSKVEAEVDADKGELKSLYYDNTAYWNHPPPVGAPITLPPSASASGASAPTPVKPQGPKECQP